MSLWLIKIFLFVFRFHEIGTSGLFGFRINFWNYESF